MNLLKKAFRPSCSLYPMEYLLLLWITIIELFLVVAVLLLSGCFMNRCLTAIILHGQAQQGHSGKTSTQQDSFIVNPTGGEFVMSLLPGKHIFTQRSAYSIVLVPTPTLCGALPIFPPSCSGALPPFLVLSLLPTHLHQPPTHLPSSCLDAE